MLIISRTDDIFKVDVENLHENYEPIVIVMKGFKSLVVSNPHQTIQKICIV